MKASYLTYLEKQGLSPRTIDSYRQYIEKLYRWCKARRFCLDQITYEQLLKYIAGLRASHKPDTINIHLAAIRHYQNHLIEEDYLTDNIAEGLIIRGGTKKVLQNFLDNHELEDLYYSYETTGVWQNNFYFRATARRNKVIVGMLVYQGLISNNLKQIQVEDVDLRKGTLYVASTRRNASRTLSLKPWQIIELKEYIEESLPVIQRHIKVYDGRLFPLNTPQFHVLLLPILKKLKTYNQKVSNNTHLRASVIVNWLKQYNIRQVQQMAGHRHIVSTESFKQDDLENLQKVIHRFHPLS